VAVLGFILLLVVVVTVVRDGSKAWQGVIKHGVAQ